jgi:PAS domain S-box-containing protein
MGLVLLSMIAWLAALNLESALRSVHEAGEALRRAHDGLELRVKERTVELAQANQELQDEIAERKRVETALRESEEKYRSHFEHVNEVIYSIDLELRVLSVSPSVERHLGYKPEELIGRSMHELNFLTANSVEAAFSDALRVLSGERIDSTVYEFIAKDGTRKLSEVSGAPLFREGKVVALVSVARDITDRRRAEEEALRRTAQLEALRQVGLELTAQLDSDHLLRSIASRAVELFQSTSGGIYLYRPERDVLEWVMPVGPCQPPVGVVLRKGEGLSGKVWETGAPLIVDDYRRWEGQASIYASYPWAAVVGVPIRWGDEFLGVLVVNTLDQRSFSRADAELLGLFATQAAIAIRNARLFSALTEERARLELLYRSSQHLSTSLDVHDVAQRALDDICAVVGAVRGAVFVTEPASDGGVDRLRLVSSAGYDIESIGGMDSRLVVRVGSGLIGWVAAQKQPALVDDVREDSRWVTVQGVDEWVRSALSVPLISRDKLIGVLTLTTGQVAFFREGHRRLTESVAAVVAVALANAQLYEQARQEIAERKRIEATLRESEERLRQIASSLREVIWLRDAQTRQVLYVNPAFEELFGQTCQSLYENPDAFLDAIHSDDRELIMKGHMSRSQGLYFDQEHRVVRPDGSVRWVWGRSFPVSNEAGEVYRIATILDDITERRQAEEQIRESLQEKEVLLREIHHRVKNNLQIVSSLLNLQARRVIDPASLEVLRESQNRVRSMALIHEKLYQAQDLAHVNFADYVRNLVAFLFASYQVNAAVVSLAINVADDVHLDIDTAIPCGLIINELVSNALKHAFADGRTGGLWIDLDKTADSQLELVVRDNGVGLPTELNFRRAKSLGLRLVASLVDQIEGNLELVNGQGALFRVTFPDPQAQAREDNHA